MTEQADPVCGEFLTFASIEFMIARHLDEHCLRIDTPTRYFLAQLRDMAAEKAARLRRDLSPPSAHSGKRGIAQHNGQRQEGANPFAAGASTLSF